MDEFFDFEKASHELQPRQERTSALSSAAASPPCFALAGMEPAPVDLPQSSLPSFPLADALPEDLGQGSFLTTNYENFNQSIPHFSKPPLPCDYCASRRFECLLLYEDQHACSSCTSLFRECSFSRSRGDDVVREDPPPGPNIMDTLHPVREDVVAQDGALTGRRFIRSSGGIGDDPSEGRSRKSNPRFSKDAVRVLKQWLANHAIHPYPTDEERDELKKETGLKRSQISNWLANARRRGKVRPPRSTSPSLASSYASAIDIPASSSLQDMHPLERWQRSPPEHEPASVSAIANAVATSDQVDDKDHSSSSSWTNHRQPSSAGSTFSVYAQSMSSLETMKSSGSEFSFGSAFSNHSQHSFGSMDALKRKDQRRRRRRSAQSPQTESRGSRMFQCTFCSTRFKTKHDWQRHEKSFHLNLEKWVCAPFGGLIGTPSGEMCVFCSAINPPDGHLETHNYEQCSEKDVAERTFYRKDHLRQHLRLTHSCSFDTPMESWKAAKMNVHSRCGFCGDRFSTWQARVDHLAAHFRAGAEMTDWQGDWGLDPAVMIVLSNAVPPWLNRPHTDLPAPTPLRTLTYKPFQQLVEPPDDGSGRCHHSACAVRLENELSHWARDRLALGAPPTDAELQDQSRWIIYMSPDPWNVTPADDAAWLTRFKRQNGLSPVQEDFMQEQLQEREQEQHLEQLAREKRRMESDTEMMSCLGLEQDFSSFGV